MSRFIVENSDSGLYAYTETEEHFNRVESQRAEGGERLSIDQINDVGRIDNGQYVAIEPTDLIPADEGSSLWVDVHGRLILKEESSGLHFAVETYGLSGGLEADPEVLGDMTQLKPGDEVSIVIREDGEPAVEVKLAPRTELDTGETYIDDDGKLYMRLGDRVQIYEISDEIDLSDAEMLSLEIWEGS